MLLYAVSAHLRPCGVQPCAARPCGVQLGAACCLAVRSYALVSKGRCSSSRSGGRGEGGVSSRSSISK